MLLMNGMYNTVDGKGGFLAQYIPGVQEGPIWTQMAVNTQVKGLGGSFVAVALVPLCLHHPDGPFFITNQMYPTYSIRNPKPGLSLPDSFYRT